MPTLTVFDLDDTLFHCFAKIYVIRADGTREPIKSSLNYEIKPGDRIDYDEFRSASLFYKTAIPIDRMVQRFKEIRKNQNPYSQIIIVTARADFDNKDLFLTALDHHGIFHDDVHVHRAGNYQDIATTPARKCHVIAQYLDMDIVPAFDKVRMFDDCEQNLQAFARMEDIYPHIEFEGWLVDRQGNVPPF